MTSTVVRMWVGTRRAWEGSGRIALLLVAGLSITSVAGAQTTGTLGGVVIDQSEAVVPGVTVTVRNISTGVQREVVSGSDGRFNVPLLPPGTYEVGAQKTGFAPASIKALIVNVGDQLNIRLPLQVAQVGEALTVTAEAARVSTAPGVATIVDRQFVENLPLNGRSFQSLIELAPGTVLTRTNFQNQGQFSVNGQRADSNYFSVDGVSANMGVSAGNALVQTAAGAIPAVSAVGGTNNLVSVDALQEFRIETSSYAPEFGRSPGAQVAIVTRSGTNQFHGTAFDYMRNEKFDANDWFANSRNLPKPPIRQHDFGGVLGGPVLRGRSFFFFSYEGLRLEQPRVTITHVPTAAYRAAAPAALQPFLNAFPIANGPDLGNGLAEFSASYADPSTLDATSLRLDHTVGSRLTLFGRYNFAPSDTEQRGAGFYMLSVNNPIEFETKTLTLGANMTVASNMLNDLRFNWSATRGASHLVVEPFGGAQPPPEALLFPFGDATDSAFAFFITGGTALAFFAGKNVDNTQRQINIVDTFSIVKGAHQVKAGIDYRQLSPTFSIRKYLQQIAFASPAALNTSIAASAAVESNQPGTGFHFKNFSAYVQDTWNVSQKLTLTYGLRWDLDWPPTGRDGNNPYAVVNFDDPTSVTLAAADEPLWETNFSDLAPRAGAAYQLSNAPGRETVLRAAGGLFYDLTSKRAGDVAGSGGFPYGTFKTLANVPYPLTAAQADPLPLVLDVPVSRLSAFDPELRAPYTWQWNVTLERALGSSQTTTVAYVGAAARRLLRPDLYQNPNPNFGTLFLYRNAEESDYHSLQLQFRRRLSGGLQALASYTLSNAEDTGSSDGGSRLPIGRVSPEVDRGPADFDVRHTFSTAVTYNIPAPPAGPVLEAIFRNWSLDGMFRARSSTPVNITVTRNFGYGNYSFRPDVVPGEPFYIEDPTAPGGMRFNRAAFVVPTEQRQGNLGRNALRGFGAQQLDLAVRREFRLVAGTRLQLRAEFFNVFNSPNFADPAGGLASATFGLSSSMLGRGLGTGGIQGGFNPLYQIGGPRSGQLALKFSF